jgi:hypothetical protein
MPRQLSRLQVFHLKTRRRLQLRSGTDPSTAPRPKVGHAIVLIGQFEDPDFWGVNPEVLASGDTAEIAGLRVDCTEG